MIIFKNMQNCAREENLSGIAGFRTETCVCLMASDYKSVIVIDESIDRISVHPVDRDTTTMKFARNVLNEDVVRIYMSDDDFTLVIDEDV